MSMIFCRGCGKKTHESAQACPSCGATQSSSNRAGKSKLVAGLLAFFLGAFGIHRFYLGQWWGLFYLLLCWTGIPSIISFVESIVFLLSNQENWDNKYGDGVSSGGSSGAAIALALIVILVGGIGMLGILAAIALPAYHDYIVRSKMSEPLAAMAEAKTTIAEYVSAKGQYPRFTSEFGVNTDLRSARNEVLEQIAVATVGDRVYVTALIDTCTWDGTSCLTSEASSTRAFSIFGDLNADGSMTWQCVPGDAQGQRAIAIKYLPANCRG